MKITDFIDVNTKIINADPIDSEKLNDVLLDNMEIINLYNILPDKKLKIELGDA